MGTSVSSPSASKSSPPNSPTSPTSGSADKIFQIANKTIDALSLPLYNCTPRLIVDSALMGLDARLPLCICSMSASPMHLEEQPHQIYDGENLVISLTNGRPMLGLVPMKWMLENMATLEAQSEILKD